MATKKNMLPQSEARYLLAVSMMPKAKAAAKPKAAPKTKTLDAAKSAPKK